MFIEGRVQGVGFRWWIAGRAKNLGLVGWVRNLKDGRVEVVVEGPKKEIKKLVEECKKGPLLSKVSHLDVSWEEATKEFEDFEIRSTV